jgi:hypothetical protein
VSENGVLSGIFESKGDEAAEGWRNLSNEELHNWHSPLKKHQDNQMEEGDMGGTCNTHGRERKCTQI